MMEAADRERCDCAIIDDDPAVLDSLRFLLEVAGHTVATYGSAAAFLADGPTCCACAIVDQHMPRMTGLDLIAELRAKGEMVPMLLITGSPSPAVVRRAAQMKVAVLEKPPEESDLLRFVRTWR